MATCRQDQSNEMILAIIDGSKRRVAEPGYLKKLCESANYQQKELLQQQQSLHQELWTIHPQPYYGGVKGKCLGVGWWQKGRWQKS